MKKIITLLLLLAALGCNLKANNIKVSNTKLTGQNTTDHYTLVQFDLTWQNSWRTSSEPNNWDAAWVFVKYRVGSGEWQHASLNNTGHSGTGATINAGLLTPGTAFNATTNPGVGAFIYRSDNGTGTFSVAGAQLRWNYGANGVADNATVDVQVFAIEMVYVPQGPFVLGSGGNETSAFYRYPTTTNTFQVNSENEITVGAVENNLYYTMIDPIYLPANSGDQSGPIPAIFPKGYNAFYCQKYEITQQQYVDFLNTLTQTQATARKYDKPTTNFRYEITGTTVGSYTTTNPYVPCCYMTWMDGAAYSDWAGLRPMTELEYEKACRGSDTPLADEFAWGSTTSTAATGISNAGASNEIPSNYGANAVYNNSGTGGPLRVGAFASSSSTRAQSGASYYGIMELSGNLWDRAVTVGHATGRAFTGVHGNGALSTEGHANQTAWPGLVNGTVTSTIGSGFRGGSWWDNPVQLRAFHREHAANIDSDRNATFGFRAVRSQPLPVITTTEATAITATTASSGGNVTFDGGGTITARGVCWSTATGPTTALTTKTTETGTTGVFTSNLPGLTASTLYYVRAYATNNSGTSYGNEVSFTTSWACGSTFAKNHTAGDVAPVSKTVTYATVSTTLFGDTKCAITQNLGSDHQATAVEDATEASAGWYWQFNHKQGYKHDGTTLTPAWTIFSISENSDWLAANDPCTLELGSGWRIPTNTEWTSADGSWTNYYDTYNSVLKLHAAGYLDFDGSLNARGSSGLYGSSTQYDANNGRSLYFSSGDSYMNRTDKVIGLTARCIKNLSPSLTTTDASDINATTANSGGNITAENASAITARGVCWSKSANPTTALATKTSDGTGIGTFTSALTGLLPSTLYHIRAYATNADGTSYGEDKTFTTAAFVCGTSALTANHYVANGVAPVDKSVSYGTVSTTLFGGPKCAITRNLGASQQATAATDDTEASAGWYWQFNKKQGYKIADDGTSRTPTTTWISGIGENSHWEAAKDPCTLELGTGWRIPTDTEWTSADGSWANYTDTYNSDLKLHAAGYLDNSDGSLNARGSIGAYWSITQYDASNGWFLYLYSGYSNMLYNNKAGGFTVRCLRDLLPILTTTTAFDINATTATSGGYIFDLGGSAVTARGVCWSTSANPTTALATKTSDGTGIGTFTSALTGLLPSTSYHIRAYATTTVGTSYGADRMFTTAAFVCGTSALTANHYVANGVAPVDKSVSYGTVSTTLFGGTKCAITHNLGAFRQALAATDNTETSAGWYWQFNRKQGYKRANAGLTPAWTITYIDETSDWLAANDPCTLELGTGWRIPTSTEWTSADVGWANYTDTYNSVLKLHAAGYLDASNGSPQYLGSYGTYWSSKQYNASYGSYLYFNSGSSYIEISIKVYGFTVRCLRD